jgi:hypothetical protein
VTISESLEWGWYGQDHNMELKSWSDHDFEERDKNPSLISKFTVSKTQQEWKEEQQRTDDY